MDSYNSNLHLGASPIMYQHAHELKQRQTLAEKTLWEYVKGRKFHGLKFRRQHPLSIFIADFYCHEKKLVIELDGSIHDLQETKEKDEARTGYFIENGIQVIRFTNEEVLSSLNEVLHSIKNTCCQR